MVTSILFSSKNFLRLKIVALHMGSFLGQHVIIVEMRLMELYLAIYHLHPANIKVAKRAPGCKKWSGQPGNVDDNQMTYAFIIWIISEILKRNHIQNFHKKILMKNFTIQNLVHMSGKRKEKKNFNEGM